jgi:hypothetical protein
MEDRRTTPLLAAGAIGPVLFAAKGVPARAGHRPFVNVSVVTYISSPRDESLVRAECGHVTRSRRSHVHNVSLAGAFSTLPHAKQRAPAEAQGIESRLLRSEKEHRLPGGRPAGLTGAADTPTRLTPRSVRLAFSQVNQDTAARWTVCRRA